MFSLFVCTVYYLFPIVKYHDWGLLYCSRSTDQTYLVLILCVGINNVITFYVARKIRDWACLVEAVLISMSAA